MFAKYLISPFDKLSDAIHRWRGNLHLHGMTTDEVNSLESVCNAVSGRTPLSVLEVMEWAYWRLSEGNSLNQVINHLESW